MKRSILLFILGVMILSTGASASENGFRRKLASYYKQGFYPERYGQEIVIYGDGNVESTIWQNIAVKKAIMGRIRPVHLEAIHWAVKDAVARELVAANPQEPFCSDGPVKRWTVFNEFNETISIERIQDCKSFVHPDLARLEIILDMFDTFEKTTEYLR